MLKRIKWWEWVGLLFLFGYFLQGLFRVITQGWTIRSAVQAVVFPLLLIVYFWGQYHWRDDDDDDDDEEEEEEDEEDDEKPFISIVMLLREERYLDREILARTASAAWGVELGTGDDDNEEAFVVGEDTHFIIKGPNGIFAVHNLPHPYFDEPDEVAEEFPELRIAHALRTHTAWRSIDLIMPPDGQPPESAHRAICRLVAQFADNNCLALLSPGTDRVIPYDESLEKELQGDDPMSTFKHLVNPPVLMISEDNPQLIRAVEEARHRWPQFVERFESRAPDDEMFSIKAGFSEGDRCEFMWVSVTAIENDVIYGRLGNEPVELTSLKEGDPVQVSVAELNDWMFVGDNDEIVGGFTIKALRDAQPDRQEN